jgi:AP-4 complex subunit epsilon-1
MFVSSVHKIKLSKSFRVIYRKIGEYKSRKEEEFIVQDWIASVKTNLRKTTLRHSQLYYNVVSLVHLTMFGYETSFGHVHAVNITQNYQI